MKTNGEARFPPTQISSSKRYCIDKIEQFVNERPGEVKILDLGCGEALNFVSLLRRHPQVAYIGVDPQGLGQIHPRSASRRSRGLHELVAGFRAQAERVRHRLRRFACPRHRVEEFHPRPQTSCRSGRQISVHASDRSLGLTPPSPMTRFSSAATVSTRRPRAPRLRTRSRR